MRTMMGEPAGGMGGVGGVASSFAIHSGASMAASGLNVRDQAMV
jgi:hypothetical protein